MEDQKDYKIGSEAKPFILLLHEQRSLHCQDLTEVGSVCVLPRANPHNICSPVYISLLGRSLFLWLLYDEVGLGVLCVGVGFHYLSLPQCCPHTAGRPQCVVLNMRQHSQLTFPVKSPLGLVLLISWKKLVERLFQRENLPALGPLEELIHKRCFSWPFSWSKPLNVSMCGTAVCCDVDITPRPWLCISERWVAAAP